MKTFLVFVYLLLSLHPVEKRNKVAPPTPKIVMPKIEYDQNCMSYWRIGVDEHDKPTGEKTWIEPNWHDLTETAKRRCQLFI